MRLYLTKKPKPFVYQYLPNFFTLFRLVATPLTYYFIMNDSAYGWAFLCFAAAGISDWVDGYLARKWDVQSKFGKIFDPIADKTLMVTLYMTLGYLGNLPGWLVGLTIGRDGLILLSALVTFAFKLPISFSPIKSSKINTFCQILLIGTVLISQTVFYKLYLPEIFIAWLMLLLIFTSGITTIWSGIEYILYFTKQLYLLYWRGSDEQKTK